MHEETEPPKGAGPWPTDADPTVSLEAVRQVLAKVPETLAEVVHADREDRLPQEVRPMAPAPNRDTPLP
jgi:hypothetical protein